MNENRAAFEAFRHAVEKLGGQSATARLIGKSQQAISARLAAGKLLWDVDVLTVERATGISRHELRPDLYPREIPARAPVAAEPTQGFRS